jgi:hypothetical protein
MMLAMVHQRNLYTAETTEPYPSALCRDNADMIAQRFTHYCEHWHITLPQQTLHQRDRGEIWSAGWSIQYLFGQDEAVKITPQKQPPECSLIIA